MNHLTSVAIGLIFVAVIIGIVPIGRAVTARFRHNSAAYVIGWLAEHPYVCLLTLASAYYFLYFRYGIDPDDEGLLLLGADSILRGQLPMADFYSYQPLSYFLVSAGFVALGNGVFAERIVLLCLLLIAAALILYSSRQTLRPFWSMIPPALYVFAPGPWYKMFFMAHLASVLAALLYYLNRPCGRRLVILGALSGLALVGRIEAGIESVLICSVVLAFNEESSRLSLSRVGRFLLLSLLVPIATLVLYVALGKWPALHENVLRYWNPWSVFARWNADSLTTRFQFTRLVVDPSLSEWAFFLGCLACSINVGLAITSVVRSGTITRNALVRLTIGAFGLAGAAYAYLYMWDSRLLQCFAIIYINGVMLAQDIASINGLKIYRAAALCVAASLVVFVTLTTRAGYYSGSITSLADTDRGFVGATEQRLRGILVPHYMAREFDRMGKFVSSAKERAAMVPIYGGQSFAYISGLTNPTFYHYVDLKVPGEQERIISALDHFAIRFCIGRRQSSSGSIPMENRPQLGNYLLSHYKAEPLGAQFMLLVRK